MTPTRIPHDGSACPVSPGLTAHQRKLVKTVVSAWFPRSEKSPTFEEWREAFDELYPLAPAQHSAG